MSASPRSYGNSLSLARTYDQDYQLTELKLTPGSGTALVDLAFSWRADGRLGGQADDLGGSRGASYG